VWQRSYFESGEPRDHRVEDQFILAGGIACAIGQRWRIVARYAQLNNESPLEVYDFGSGRFGLGVEARFY